MKSILKKVHDIYYTYTPKEKKVPSFLSKELDAEKPEDMLRTLKAVE